MDQLGNFMPQPLKPGEVYCWQCRKFFWLKEHEKHNKECTGRARQ